MCVCSIRVLACNTHVLCVCVQKGFGNIDSEYWLGLDNMYRLSSQMDYKLLVELEDWVGKKVYAEYSSFTLEPESQGYRLRLGAYQGNAGDSLSSNNGKQFTTLDRDKDTFSGGGCFLMACTEPLSPLSPQLTDILSPLLPAN